MGYAFETGVGLGVTSSVSYSFGRVRDDGCHDEYDTGTFNDSHSRSFDVVSLKVGLSHLGGERSRRRGRDW
jgi:hypothetical protein